VIGLIQKKTSPWPLDINMPINKVDPSVGGKPGEIGGVDDATDTARSLGDELLPRQRA
jgi:hypothetical protein